LKDNASWSLVDTNSGGKLGEKKKTKTCTMRKSLGEPSIKKKNMVEQELGTLRRAYYSSTDLFRIILRVGRRRSNKNPDIREKGINPGVKRESAGMTCLLQVEFGFKVRRNGRKKTISSKSFAPRKRKKKKKAAFRFAHWWSIPLQEMLKQKRGHWDGKKKTKQTPDLCGIGILTSTRQAHRATEALPFPRFPEKD